MTETTSRLDAIEERLSTLAETVSHAPDPTHHHELRALQQQLETIRHDLNGVSAGLRERQHHGVSRVELTDAIRAATATVSEGVGQAFGAELRDVRDSLQGKLNSSVGAAAASAAKAEETATAGAREAERMLRAMAFRVAHDGTGPVLHALAAAETTLRSALNAIDARWQSLPVSAGYVPAGDAPAGMVLVSLAKRGHFDPFVAARRVKAETRAQIATARGHLDAARAEAGLWADVADSIENGTPPPGGADVVTRAAIASVQSGGKLGLLDSGAVASELQRCALKSLSDVRDTEAAFEVKAQTAGIAVTRQSSLFWERCSKAALSEHGRAVFAKLAEVYGRKHAARKTTYSKSAPIKQRGSGKLKRPAPTVREVRELHRKILRKLK